MLYFFQIFGEAMCVAASKHSAKRIEYSPTKYLQEYWTKLEQYSKKQLSLIVSH